LSEIVNVGIIGFGKMGQLRAQVVSESGRGQVNMIYEPDTLPVDLEYARAVDVETIVKNDSIDAVFICTPNFQNKPFTIQALEAGKHVFCEKPPAFTADDVVEIIEAEKHSNKKLMYGFNHRHHDSLIMMKRLVDGGEYGKILWMRGRYGKSVDESFFETWRAKKRFAGGGILLDQGIHMLDLFLMLGGGFDKVQSEVSNLYWNLDIEDNVFAVYKNSESGVVASLHSTMTQWRHLFSLEVFLEKGYMVLNGLKTSSGTYGEEVLSIAKNRTTAPAATWEDEEHITFKTNNSWTAEVSHFFDAILHDKEVVIGSSQNALEIMKLIDMTYRNGNK